VRLRSPVPIAEAREGVTVVGIRVVSADVVYTALCKVIDGEVHGWPYSRPPTHCVTVPT
jgi:hypothetical protein